MIALDTNILVYAHRPEFPFHEDAKKLIRELATGPRPWAIAMHCLIEFAGAVSHAGRFRQPSTGRQALDQVTAWTGSPDLVVLYDGPAVLEEFFGLMVSSKVSGARVHDARIAAACIAGGVSELLTCDRDYSRFPSLSIRNPFVEVQ